MDTFNHRINILERIWDEIQPDKVIYFPNLVSLSYDGNMKPQGSTLAECIPVWAQKYQIDQLILPLAINDDPWKIQIDIHINFLTRLKKCVDLLPDQLYQIIIRSYWAHQHPIFSNCSNKGNVKKARIVMKKEYDVNDDLCSQLLRKGIYSLPFETMIVRNRSPKLKNKWVQDSLNRAWESVIIKDWFWETGYLHNLSYRSILRPILMHFWFKIIPELWQCRAGSILKIEKERPNAILYSTASGFNDIGFLMAVREKNVPVICYQHGASVGDIENPTWDVLDRFFSDYMFVYGNGEYDYINSRPDHGDSNAIPITVGSARFDEIAKKNHVNTSISIRQSCFEKNNNPTILYIPGVYFNNFHRYTYNMKNAPYFEVRNKMAQLFAGNSQINFLYKSFISDGKDPTLKILKEVCPKCRIISNIPLSELQWSTDVLIHEFPSTAMYEGLLTDKPMIVYADRDIYRMSSEAKDLLRKRVILAECGDAFIEKTKEFLDDENFAPIKNPNREFLKRYCTHLDNGQSANRAADAIATIVKKANSTSQIIGTVDT